MNGACGTTINTCTSGTLSDTADTATTAKWNCVGSNGGTTASCTSTVHYLEYYFNKQVGGIGDSNDKNITFASKSNYTNSTCGYYQVYDSNGALLGKDYDKSAGEWYHDCYDYYTCPAPTSGYTLSGATNSTCTYCYFSCYTDGYGNNSCSTNCYSATPTYNYTIQGVMTDTNFRDLAAKLVNGGNYIGGGYTGVSNTESVTLSTDWGSLTSKVSLYAGWQEPTANDGISSGDHFTVSLSDSNNLDGLSKPSENGLNLANWWGYYKETVTADNQNYVVYMVYDLFSPIILDLAGVQVPDVANGYWLPHEKQFDYNRAKVFDMTGEGYFMLTEWVGPNSGILCTLDENGKVSSALQLFGTAGGWSDGYAKLAALFDKDKNGVIEGEELNGLYVWHDRNMDAIATPDELQPVQKWGITRIWVKHDKYRSIFERNGKHYHSWDWWPSATAIKKEDRNELLKGQDIRKQKFNVRPMDGNDFMKEMHGKTNAKEKQSSSAPVKDVLANQTNKVPGPQKKDAPLPVSSPYIAMTQTSDYYNITQFKKRRR